MNNYLKVMLKGFKLTKIVIMVMWKIWWVKETGPVWLEAGVWCVYPHIRACLYIHACQVTSWGRLPKQAGS